MPRRVVHPPPVNVATIPELRRDRFLVGWIETEMAFDNRSLFETNFSGDDVIELGTRIIAQGVEVPHRTRRIEPLQCFQQSALPRFVRPDQNGFTGLNIEKTCIANTTILSYPRFF